MRAIVWGFRAKTEIPLERENMKNVTDTLGTSNRRSFIKNGAVAGAAATVGAGILSSGLAALSETTNKGKAVTKGDIAILRFLAAAEILESDLWEQYTELGGTQDAEEHGVNGGSPLYMAALQILDSDMPQYIHDNTDDEKSHFGFINLRQPTSRLGMTRPAMCLLSPMWTRSRAQRCTSGNSPATRRNPCKAT